MKKLTILLFPLIINLNGFSQTVARIDSGTIHSAKYNILFPENYQNKLMMFAHGYEFMGSPPSIEQPQFLQLMNIFLERGYAVAASSYAYQGYALPRGVDDTEDLRKYFWDKYGVPDSTFMAGMSMGGGVTLAMMENFSAYYQGALAMCPLSSRPYLQTRKEFDAHALFEVLFPNVIAPLSEIMDIHSNYSPTGFSEMMSKSETIKKAIFKDTVKAAEFARQFDLKINDIPFTLLFGEPVLRDIVIKSGGNPYDNTNTIYTGFSNDREMNRKVVRLKATVNPDILFEKYDRTGNIGKPVVLLHTIYDQLIPPLYGEVNFENMVHMKGKDQFLTVKISNGQGHCNFTPEQIGKSFDALRHWVISGEKAKPGMLK